MTSVKFVTVVFQIILTLGIVAPRTETVSLHVVTAHNDSSLHDAFFTSDFNSSIDDKELLNISNTDNLNFTEKELNYRPIIGILSQGLSRGMRRVFNQMNYTSYIAASYVKFVESAGARVVPVLIDQTDDYYEHLGNTLNGFLFPGGGAKIPTSKYSRTVKKIFDIVKRKATEGKEHIPLWATCLGFENLVYFEANQNPLSKCSASNMADPLMFQPGYKDSQLFGSLSDDILKSLSTKNITANFHKWCVLPQTFYELGLNESMTILSTTKDKFGIEYISTLEHKELPIFGTQWHPEKAAFEWANDAKHNEIPHNIEAIRASQALAETFVQKARENSNHFASQLDEENYLIYNYDATYVGIEYKSSFQLCYFF